VSVAFLVKKYLHCSYKVSLSSYCNKGYALD